MNGLIFEFVSTSADALSSTNTALGKVIMATDYNALDSVFVNENEMYACEFCNSGKPSETMIHAVECSPAENPLKLNYIRSGDVPSGADLRFYDLGIFEIATVGSQAAATIGDLWVSYDVTLCKPSLQSVVGGDDLLWAHARIEDYDNTDASGLYKHIGNIFMYPDSAFSVTNSTVNTLVFPNSISSGRYMITHSIQGGSASCTQPILTVTNGQQIYSWFANNAQDALGAPFTGVAGTSMIFTHIVECTAPGLTIQYVGTYPSNYTSIDIIIAQMPDELGPPPP